MAKPKDANDWQAVETAEDFAAFLTLLSQHLAVDEQDVKLREAVGGLFAEGEWRHPGLAEFLEAWSAWLQDSFLSEGAPFERASIEPPSWRTFAFQLWATRFYE